MYLEFYNLHSAPFENTPDPRFFYASEQHREALAAIEYTIRLRKGFVLISGDIGSGKTTVGRTMCERCGDKALIVQVLHGHEDGPSLLRQVLRVLDVPLKRSDDHARMLERLRERLVDQIDKHQPVVLLVDEAQTLSDEALEELRLMSNFDTNSQKLIQIVLIGQPELRHRIRSPRLSALRQRIMLAKQLHPLDERETTAYIAHRLRAASQDPEKPAVAFHPQAAQEIYKATGGVPRLINVLCDNCLLLAYVREAREVTVPMVRRGLEDMVPNFADAPWTSLQPQASLSVAGSY